MGTTQATESKLTIPCPSCGRLNRITSSKASNGPKCGACRAALPLDHPVHLTDATFQRVISGTDVPVFVDFYADWCGPCKMMAPSVDRLARESVGTALIAKLDTDASPRTSQQLQIRGIPTSIVFRGGQEATRQTGAVPYEALRKMLG